jgi:hypothetical protein
MKTTTGKILGIALTVVTLAGGAVRGAPPTLVFSTYLGGAGQDRGAAIALDEQGNPYVAGPTGSLDFPGALTGPNVPPYPPYRPTGSPPYVNESFVARLDTSGRLLSTAFLGTATPDIATGLAVGPSSVDVTGYTISSNGTSIFWARFGRPNLVSGYTFGRVTPEGYWPMGFGIAEDPAGEVFITGRAPDGLYWDYPKNGTLALVAKWSPVTGLVYYHLYDGSDWFEMGSAIATDAAGNAYVVGSTISSDFPLGHPFQGAFHGGTDVFVMKIDPVGRLVYSTYLGGSGGEFGSSIAVAPSGEAYITGTTTSADFPLTSDALDKIPVDGSNVFLAKLDRAGTLSYSTYLGVGSSSVAVDPAGRVFLAGNQISAGAPFIDPRQPGCTDSFVASLEPQDPGSVRSLCLPGASIQALAVDSLGHAYVTGEVKSAAFPLVNAFQTSPGGQEDAFVAKIAFNHPPDCTAAFASPATLSPPDGRLVPISIRNVTDSEGDPVAITVTGVRQDEPLQGTANAFGIGTPNVSIRADRDGKGDGRVYHLSFTASDPQGASCTGTVTVCVPHDQGRGSTCGDGGGVFDSGR